MGVSHSTPFETPDPICFTQLEQETTSKALRNPLLDTLTNLHIQACQFILLSHGLASHPFHLRL